MKNRAAGDISTGKDNRIPVTPPVINILDKQIERPLWSVMIPVYNCIEHLEEAIASVINQNNVPGDMQIEVVDDASTDGDVFELVQRVGKGRVRYYRHTVNMGSLRTFETCINRSTGHYVHILHADDKVHDGFYSEIGSLFEEYPAAGAAFCRFEYMDESGAVFSMQSKEIEGRGIIPRWFNRIATNNRMQFAAVVVRREVYEKLGGFYGLTYGEDWIMWVRIARHFPVMYSSKPLAAYRKHRNSITGAKILSGEYAEDLKRAMAEISHIVPADKKVDILKASRRYYSDYCLKMAMRLLNSGQDPRAVNVSIRQALSLDAGLTSLWGAFRLYVKNLSRLTNRKHTSGKLIFR